jgi:DNA-binding transcriptional MerR regulator
MNHLSQKALRLYDRKGLLVPEENKLPAEGRVYAIDIEEEMTKRVVERTN